ncbi:MAG: pyridoxal-phosphate dependent enzyme [Bacteroidales bacterium]|nr:pyridoxal-phosphate dependent enzyme [Bacteroidales bacterium]
MDSQSNQTNNSPFSLIDGASGFGLSVSHESEELSKIVTNLDNDINERLEAFEDIINIDIGDTSLGRARNLERETGLRQLYIKFEGGNPTGTQKDRIAFAQCHDALRRNFDSITLATCGNYGVAVALAAHLAGLKCFIFIPETYHTRRIIEMEKMGATIVRTPGNYEDAVEHSKQVALDREYYDANPGGANTHLQLISYAEIAFEIYDVLHDAPKIVAAPVSNGTMLAGIHRGFATLFKRGKTSRIPRIVAGSSFKKNPIILSFKKGLDYCADLSPETIRETKVNEALINWHSFDGDIALNSIYSSEGWADDVSDSRLSYVSKLLKDKEGLSVLPASTAGLIALLEMHKKEDFNNDRFVAVLTGRK